MLKADHLSARLDALVSQSLLQGLQDSGAGGLEVPELALETTVLNRLAVLEALCSSQAHTIKRLQLEVDYLRRSPAATPSVEPPTVSKAVAAYHSSCKEYVLSAKHSTPRTQQPASTAQDAHALQPRAHSSNAVEGINSTAIQAVHQRAASGSTSAACATSRVHTLSDPATALQPLSREKFLAKLPKVVIKAGQILPIQSCIKALLTESLSSGNPAAASDADMQKLSAMIASVLVQNQDLLTSTADAHAGQSADSSSQQVQSLMYTQSSPQEVDLVHTDNWAISAGIAHTAASDKSLQNRVLAGAISGHEVFNVNHNASKAAELESGDFTGSIQAAAETDGPDEDVGCNSLVSFFLAEMLGGSAE